MDPAPSAFHDTCAQLRTQLREARVDHEAFETLLRPCELATCRATCCHDGVVLSTEEAACLSKLLTSHPATFHAAGFAESSQAILDQAGTMRTGLRPAADHECATDFPPHFARTRCVFLDPQHRCTLQVLSTSAGHHPWFFKPVSCWMHPILLRPPGGGESRPLLTLRHPSNDSARFASCTPCGRPDSSGLPARHVLAQELQALSVIAQRDFTAELDAPSADFTRD